MTVDHNLGPVCTKQKVKIRQLRLFYILCPESLEYVISSALFLRIS